LVPIVVRIAAARAELVACAGAAPRVPSRFVGFGGLLLLLHELWHGSPAMAPVDHKTMFEIYRETDYNRAFRCVFFTDLDEHNRGKEIARAAAGETVFSGFISDDRKPEARAEVEAIVEELNGMDEDSAGLPADEFRRRLAAYLVA